MSHRQPRVASGAVSHLPAHPTSRLGGEREPRKLAEENSPSILHPEMLVFLRSSAVRGRRT